MPAALLFIIFIPMAEATCILPPVTFRIRQLSLSPLATSFFLQDRDGRSQPIMYTTRAVTNFNP